MLKFILPNFLSPNQNQFIILFFYKIILQKLNNIIKETNYFEFSILKIRIHRKIIAKGYRTKQLQ